MLVRTSPYAWDAILRVTGEESAPAITLAELDGTEVCSSPGQPLKPERHYDLSSFPPAELRALGEQVGGLLLPQPIKSQIASRAAKGPVRIGLQVSNAAFSNLPWELAWLGEKHGGPLALCPNVHVYRIVRSANTPALGLLRRVLVACANPDTATYPMLPTAQRELETVARIVQSSRTPGVTVVEAPYATPSSLRRLLDEHRPDVFHFIGHGDVGPSGGRLVFEDGRPHQDAPVYVDELAPLLLRAGVKLVVLSSCLTGGLARSIGQDLVMAGIPAVIGMQQAVDDAAARLFSRTFYTSFMEGIPLEIALDDGRAAISGFASAWAAPVFMSEAGADLRVSFGRSAPEPVKPDHNFPEEDRPFIGRSQEREAVHKLLARPTTRLVTLTGMGGMGKTRLAKQVALDLFAEFSNGARLIECEALEGRDELLAALASAQGLPGGSVSEERLLDSLKSQQRLLVFDCFERIAECAKLLANIVRTAPGVKILVTSRVLLGVPAEKEYSLDPMSLKKRKTRMAEGLELFAESASFADPKFQLDRKNQALVTRLVEDLEGVPLAIVLAAGRLRHMSIEELASRVQSQRLEVLRRRPTGPDDRHADLLRVVGDSLELLESAERELVKTLSVFQGGFFQDDAWAVLGRTPEVEEGISLLRDHSLLMAHVVGSRMRFRLLDTIREYLDRTPDDDAVATVRSRHAAHFATLAATLRSLYDSGKYQDAREALSLDMGNFRASVHHAVRFTDKPLVRSLATSLARVYFESGAKDEFEALANAVETAVDESDLPLLIELHGLHGELCRRSDRLEDATSHWQIRAKLCEKAGDLEGEVDSILDMADLALKRRDLAAVDELLGRFETLRSRLPAGPILASGYAVRAKLQLQRGQTMEALRTCDRMEEIMRGKNVDRQSLFVWTTLGQIYRTAGAVDDWVRLSQKLLYDGIVSGHFMSAGRALLELSDAAEARGDLELAAHLAAIACLIPAAVSSALRDQSLQRRKALSKGSRKQIMDRAAAAIAKANWEILALEQTPPTVRAGVI
jgi:predicted ATPase